MAQITHSVTYLQYPFKRSYIQIDLEDVDWKGYGLSDHEKLNSALDLCLNKIFLLQRNIPHFLIIGFSEACVNPKDGINFHQEQVILSNGKKVILIVQGYNDTSKSLVVKAAQLLRIPDPKDLVEVRDYDSRIPIQYRPNSYKTELEVIHSNTVFI